MLKITWRSLLKNKLTFGLNLLGLAVGMAAFLTIAQYMKFELSYDQFYGDADRVFRVNTFWSIDGEEERYATAPPPLAEVIREEIPEAEAVCRVFYWSDFTMRPENDFENAYRETEVYAVDESFFEVFDFGLIEGDPKTVLSEPTSVVLPRSAAIKYFGKEAVERGNIVGRRIMGGKDAGTPWTITGLMEDQPANSHLQFEFLVSANSYPDDLYRNQIWSWNVMHTYLRVSEKAVAEAGWKAQLEELLDQIVDKYALPFMDQGVAEFRNSGNRMEYLLQPLTDIHLTSNYLREMRPNGNMTYVKVFGLIALLTIFIAGINFVNLATAQASRRAREVGVKKVMGASRPLLIRQFLAESMVVSGLAAGLALIFTKGLTRLTGNLLDVSFLESADWSSMGLIAAGLWLVVGFLSGIYPAFYLSWFRPAEVLKGQHRSGWSDTAIRNGLVVFQFVLSIGLITASLVIKKQVDLFQDKQLGFTKEQVVVIENDREIEERGPAFKEELRRHPDIIQASFSNGIPGLNTYQRRDFKKEGDEVSWGVDWYQIDEDHLETLEIELQAGRNFRAGTSADSTGLILNEAAVAYLGLDKPIGKYLIKNEGTEDEERLEIIGVVRDFNLESLHHKVKPLAIQYFQGFVFKDYITVRLAAGNPRAAIDHIEKSWQAFEPGVPLRYGFLDVRYDQLYKGETRLANVFALFTGLAIFIACLGLFGLITFVVARRTKEIGIRKILGASTQSILQLLSRDFLLLVGIAFLIAAPLSWWAMQRWLENFAYRIELHWWMPLLAGLAASLIAVITISLRSWSAARANPVDGLRDE
ncbi:ABC transporter permease [Flavilitoribacter nigricans]|uniref:Cell division protein FtsX n=1 Tax=Flavilitoribacter nigricans (strain ATCC 23147 / DSM 23189 / NBRC 102662 / NCIMB 1420 / SS-2) TaxID=1122177 RepID=A0A2D0N0B3_FLAN2|nr:ABC transporter permease [Flavilitoribacter nigricans]PHN01954.1 cell division protein FtsX [Flavilitoribacter nigricans DSM 23189 = NBRC 102662]